MKLLVAIPSLSERDGPPVHGAEPGDYARGACRRPFSRSAVPGSDTVPLHQPI